MPPAMSFRMNAACGLPSEGIIRAPNGESLPDCFRCHLDSFERAGDVGRLGAEFLHLVDPEQLAATGHRGRRRGGDERERRRD